MKKSEVYLGSNFESWCPAPGLDPSELAILSEVKQIILCLSPSEKRLLILRFWEGKSLEAISDKEGCARQTVKNRLSRILTKLMAEFFHEIKV